MKRKISRSLLLPLFIISSSFSFICILPDEKVEKLSLSLSSSVLEKGKKLSVKAEVYYKKEGGVMVTHFTAPFENITLTNSGGQIRIYDPGENSVLQMQDNEFSSESSFFYNFLNGKTQDMGLRAAGFKLSSSRIEDGLVITEWIPGEKKQSSIGRVELVHEKLLPVYIAFYSQKPQLVQKVYYTNFSKVGNIQLPMNVTEFSYTEKGDSTVTRKLYSSPKINKAVSDAYLNYKIPLSAKVITQQEAQQKVNSGGQQ